MKNSIELAQEISRKLIVLADKYSNLKKQIADLEAESERLREVNAQLEADNAELKERFKVYKMSMAISGHGNDTKETKRFINQMVREIDKCIALLNR